jgi:hypothetical protein
VSFPASRAALLVDPREADLRLLVEKHDLAALVVQVPHAAEVEERFQHLRPDTALLNARTGVVRQQVHEASATPLLA